MHVLVEGGELVDVAVVLVGHVVGKAREARLQHVVHVGKRDVQFHERQVPARVVVDGYGIVNAVAGWMDGIVAVEAAQDEPLREPSNMADFPPEGVDDGEPRPDELVLIQPRDQLERPDAGIAHDLREGDGGHGFSHRSSPAIVAR